MSNFQPYHGKNKLHLMRWSCLLCTSSLVKIAFDLKEIATEFFFPLSFRERPKIKYIKSLPKSTHGKDVIFYHKKFCIFADFNVTDGMPYTDYLSRGDNKSFFPLWIEISINILCDNYEFDKYSSLKIQHNYHIYHLKI
jgi:hypothetical protein